MLSRKSLTLKPNDFSNAELLSTLVAMTAGVPYILDFIAEDVEQAYSTQHDDTRTDVVEALGTMAEVTRLISTLVFSLDDTFRDGRLGNNEDAPDAGNEGDNERTREFLLETIRQGFELLPTEGKRNVARTALSMAGLTEADFIERDEDETESGRETE